MSYFYLGGTMNYLFSNDMKSTLAFPVVISFIIVPKNASVNSSSYITEIAYQITVIFGL